MKTQIALLSIIQNLLLEVSISQKLLVKLDSIESENSDILTIKDSAKVLLESSNTLEAKDLAKGLAKGVTKCPFCEEKVRQIRPHLKVCQKSYI